MNSGTQPGLPGGTIFLAGLLFGFALAGLLGFILQQIRLGTKSVRAYELPMTVTLKTEKTPRQVGAAASQGQLKRLLGYVALVFLLVIALRCGYPLIDFFDGAASAGQPPYLP
ncbi:MAG: hypothetical protein GXY76_22505 [Chloroflexi bacterium]|nr:hypothetical protein [Chloroflexota bacterium]